MSDRRIPDWAVQVLQREKGQPRFIPPISRKATPLAAIKVYCRHCLGELWDTEAMTSDGDGLAPGRDCTSRRCPLYPYRTGRNPNLGGAMSDEQREAAVARLRRHSETG